MARLRIEYGSRLHLFAVLVVLPCLICTVILSAVTVERMRADRQAQATAQVTPTDGSTPGASRLSEPSDLPGGPVRPADARPDRAGAAGRPGIAVVVSPVAGGAFAVTETVRLADPSDTITLDPGSLARAGTQFRSAAPVATSVRVVADGVAVEVPGGAVSERVTLAVDGAQDFEVTYTLEGTVVLSRPALSPRALAAVAPLTDSSDDQLPVQVSVSGPGVLSLNCPTLSLAQRACGQGTAPDLEVGPDLPYGRAVVTIQLDVSA